MLGYEIFTVFELPCVVSIAFHAQFHHRDPGRGDVNSCATATQAWSAVKSAGPILCHEVLVFPVFVAGEEEDGDSLGCEAVFVRISADAGNSFWHFPVFLDEGTHESTETHVNMHWNLPGLAVRANNAYLIASSIRIVGI